MMGCLMPICSLYFMDGFTFIVYECYTGSIMINEPVVSKDICNRLFELPLNNVAKIVTASIPPIHYVVLLAFQTLSLAWRTERA